MVVEFPIRNDDKILPFRSDPWWESVVIFQGGNSILNCVKIEGGEPLRGTLRVSGSKNAALALLSGALLVEGEVILHNVPYIQDVATMLTLLERLGVQSAWQGSAVVLQTRELTGSQPPADLVSKMRASFYIFAPLMIRQGHAFMPKPGGCSIGTRPVDYHLNGLQAMGARVVEHTHGYEADLPGELTGARIYFDVPSAGATQHLMAAAVRARGLTTIENAAMEPEVVNLANFLNACGGRVEGAGTSTVVVEGVSKLKSKVEFSVIPDRLEAGTFALAAAATHGDVTLERVMPEHLHSLFAKMREAGVIVEEAEDSVRIKSARRYKAVDIHTMPYPGFPTDLQQPMSAFLALAEGTSFIRETIYERRAQHVSELQKMGAEMMVEGRTIIIRGVETLRGASVNATDLRGGAALIIAALAAQGCSEIHHMEHVDRGYSRLEENLQSLGARIQRLSTSAVTQPLNSDYAPSGL